MSPRRAGRFWLLTAAALLVAAATAALGVWQLGRAAQKEALLAQREARIGLPALGWEELLAARSVRRLAEDYDRAVRLRGRWRHEATVFLDNRQLEGRAGFIVVTPFQPVGGTVLVAVQRGWVPRRFDDRSALPSLLRAEGEVEIEGRMAPPPSKLYEFAGVERGAIRQNIDLESYAAEWQLDLLPASLQQTGPGASQDDLLRRWPVVGLDVHKHYGYAFQWFGLCALVLGLYVWFQLLAPRRR
ncbi:MAG: hypothetical protein RJA36_3051 [Pseudomonadota bacterium]|jgi:surfeit locus 1 family protein